MSPLYAAEAAILENAKQLALKESISVKDYTQLVGHYEKLLKDTIKLVRISDNTQNKLLKVKKHLGRANDHLVKTSEQKSELLGMVVHDLKNRLGPICTISDMLHDEIEDLSADTGENVQMLRESAWEMVHAIDNTLTREASQSEEIMLVKEWCDLKEVINTTVFNLKKYAERKNINLHIEDFDHCEVQVDEFLLREVFNNLINNAIKFSPEQKNVWVSLTQRDTGKNNNERNVIHFSVSDEGQGLTDEDLQNLFQRFSKLSSKPTGNEKSTGLGLSIVKKLVELHGGKIWAESKGKGKGATFIVELPQS